MTNAFKEYETTLLDLIRDDERGVPAKAAWFALQRKFNIDIDLEAFDEIVLRLIKSNKLRCPEQGPQRRLFLFTAHEAPPPRQIDREADLEPHVEGFLWRNFHEKLLVSEAKSSNLIVQNTARGGKPDGLWRRPDIAAAVVSRFSYQPAPQLDLFGFEIKMPSGCKVYAVHEALAHTAFVHFAYLVLYLPGSLAPDDLARRSLPQVLEQAQLHGIGVIEVKDPHSDAAFSVRLQAERKQPSPRRIDDFIDGRMHPVYRLALQSWIHSGTR